MEAYEVHFVEHDRKNRTFSDYDDAVAYIKETAVKLGSQAMRTRDTRAEYPTRFMLSGCRLGAYIFADITEAMRLDDVPFPLTEAVRR